MPKFIQYRKGGPYTRQKRAYYKKFVKSNKTGKFKAKVKKVVTNLAETQLQKRFGAQLTYQLTPGQLQFSLLNLVNAADREGTEILPTKIDLTIAYQQAYVNPGYYGSQSHTSNHMVIWIPAPHGTAPVDTDLFDATHDEVYSGSPYHIANRKNFKVLARWQTCPNYNNAIAAVNWGIEDRYNTMCYKHLSIKLGDRYKVEWDGVADTIADFKRGACYFVSWIGKENQLPTDANFAFAIHYASTMYYKDF